MRVPVRVCFVCSGNICRSPTAEVVLIRQARDARLEHLVEVDSAGTGGWHAGDDMDDRARTTLADAGYAVPRHVARQFEPSDFEHRDVLVALDGGHYAELLRMAAHRPDPDAARRKIVRLRAFDPKLESGEDPDVADPYYGGPDGFADVLDQVERSCARLLEAIERAVDGGADSVQQPDQQTDSPPR